MNKVLKLGLKEWSKKEEDSQKGGFTIDNKSNLYGKFKQRQKVWETVIELLNDNPDIETVEDIVEHHFKKNNGKMEADICIKSQYGSKREFYVINLGAKACARIVEKFFLEFAKNVPSECISIPGDKKLITMQKLLNNAMKYAQDNGLNIRYVNGDCTKWSAAETMQSFITMCDAFEGYVPDNFLLLLKTIFSMWSKKKINIPMNVIKNTSLITEKSEYLKSLNKDGKSLNSTQNFLQGMFNYASSIKSSACSAYSEKIWRELHPDSKLRCFHMEHSDDYVQIIVYENEEEFNNYRAMHKLLMKMHGFNDSDRKTSCQSLFMEFVSLMSFNGQMLYPKIKKTKEINLNLPCTGYKFDVEAALSRQGECMRMGCNHSYSYYFMKSHIYCLSEAYSLLDGMRNDTTLDKYNLPIELYGIPDQLPCFSLFCKGNVNNFRIFNFGDIKMKKLISSLIKLSKMNEENIFNDDEKYDNFLYHPVFKYDMKNNSLKRLMNEIDIKPDDVKNFWDEHISYKFIKPRNSKLLLKWLKFKFLDKSFVEAYSQCSRTKMTMRISRFVSKKTIELDYEYNKLEYKDKPENIILYTMNETREILLKKLEEIDVCYEYREIINILTKSDPTVSIIYNLYDCCNMQTMRTVSQRRNTIGILTPQKVSWFYVENNPSLLLQYYLNPDDFYLDKRKGFSEFSMQKDIEIIEQHYNIKDKKLTTMKVLQLYNDLSITKYKRVVMMGFNNYYSSLCDILFDIMENNTLMVGKLYHNEKNVFNIVNPYTGVPYYVGMNKNTTSTNQQCLENLCLLYVYLKTRYNYTDTEVTKVLDNIIFYFYEDNKKYNLNYKQLLSTFDYETLKLMNEPLLTKLATYFKYKLNSDSLPLYTYVNDSYSYSYYYKKGQTVINNQYHGEIECYFKYLNYFFMFKQKDMNLPHLYTVCDKPLINKIAYLIALRLGNHKSDKETLEVDSLNFNLDDYLIENDFNEIRLMRTIDKKGFEWSFNRNLKQTTYLIFKAKFIEKHLYQKNNKSTHLSPQIDDKNHCVKFGKYKLFTLPFWKCNQHKLVWDWIGKEELFLEGIPISEFFDKRIFKRFLHNHGLNFTSNLNINYSDDVVENIKKYVSNIDEIKNVLDDNNNKKMVNIAEEVSNMLMPSMSSQSISINMNFKVNDDFSDDEEEDLKIQELIRKMEEDEKKKKEIDPVSELSNIKDGKDKVFNLGKNFSDDFVEEKVKDYMFDEEDLMMDDNEPKFSVDDTEDAQEQVKKVYLKIESSIKLKQQQKSNYFVQIKERGVSFFITKLRIKAPLILEYFSNNLHRYTPNIVDSEDLYSTRVFLKNINTKNFTNKHLCYYYYLLFLYFHVLKSNNNYCHENPIHIYHKYETNEFIFLKKRFLK